MRLSGRQLIFLLPFDRLMALLELATNEEVDCSELVICVDRTADAEDFEDVTRDLGWVGFEMMMLDSWCDGKTRVSDRWLFLGMEV